MSGLCKDCKWWFFDKEDRDEWGECILHGDTFLHEDEQHKYRSEILNAKAIALPGQGSQIARLVTAPDFGCNGFKSKINNYS